MITDPLVLAGISFTLFFILLFSGVKIGIALAMAGSIGFFLYRGDSGLISLIPFRTLDNFVLTCLPFFILMGELLILGGSTERLFQGVSKLINWLPGGLLHTNIITCAMFAAISGSSPATAATIGTVSIPSLKKRNYDDKMILGSLTCGGTLGILIPPSVNLIVYGMLAEVSIGRLFAAGMMPGILLSGIFMAYIIYSTIKNPNIAPRESNSSIKEIIYCFKDILPIFLLILIVLGGIFGGVMTPTEAAAVGVIISLLLVFIFKKFTWLLFKEALLRTLRTTCMILLIVVGSSMLASFFAMAGVPKTVTEMIVNSGVSKYSILWGICIIYLFLGCFIDPVSIIVLTASTVLPIIKLMGFDMVWFGVIYVITAEIGMVTPPMGMNLFVIKGISNESISKIVQGSLPFLILMIFCLVILVYFPLISLWLPNLFFGVLIP